MSFTLQVTPTTDVEAAETYVFDSPVVVIGRDESADLQLTDVARIVSNRHAEVRQTADALSLVDLGSKNGTMLNGRRLRSREVAHLREADAFEVGDFEIRVVRIEATEALAGTSETLVAQEVDERAIAAVSDPLGDSDEDPDHSTLEETGQKGDFSDVMDSTSMGSQPSQEAPPVDAETHALDAPSEVVPPSDNEMLDALLAAVARLAGIPWQFRHEFIGQTIAPPEEEAVFADGSPEALKRFLFDPRLDSEEMAGRRAALAAAVEAGALHQVAMLDGYKAGIDVGTRHLLEALDPAAAREDVRQGGFWQRLPVLRDVAALKRLTQSHVELVHEDESVAERGRFRPAFIKAYLARMTRRSNTPDVKSPSVHS